ncbi:MAG TPA: HNH endonuclease signature motif containing protein [Candidatus Dormibacteraeota bacterium]
MRSDGLRLSPGARAALARRCGGACEACGLEWPWLLYVFRVEEAGPDVAANLRVLCSRCSEGQAGAFRTLLGERTLRERLRDANNRRSGAPKLTDARRRRLIAARGGRCQACGAPASERQLDVHHRQGIFAGGDDSEENLMVLCFACHHHLRPCVAGCGRWAKLPARLCRRCQTAQLVASWT